MTVLWRFINSAMVPEVATFYGEKVNLAGKLVRIILTVSYLKVQPEIWCANINIDGNGAHSPALFHSINFSGKIRWS